MLQSKLFTKTRREAPHGEPSLNARLLIQGGFIHKEMAGVYTYLPLGWRVLKNIENTIRAEMNATGAHELFMTTLQDPELWKKSGRWTDEEESDQGLPWFKTQFTAGGEAGIANTHEEVLANIMRHHVASYKDLPVYAYQIQNKFRNELRAKSGLMRGREFLMKDLYSFTSTQEELDEYYDRVIEAYLNIFKRVGLGDITYRTFASGGAFSKFSDEFQTISEAGEDTVYVDEDKKIAVNEEVYTDDVLEELNLAKDNLVEKKSIEVGNIFKLGTKYSEAVGLNYKDEEGNEHPVVMGSYGIGLSRLMGAIVEVKNDDAGIIWPDCVAPFSMHIIALSDGDDVYKKAEEVYNNLNDAGVEVLFDDRQNVTPGEKFADADLIGIPTRVVVSEKSLEKGGVEVKNRESDETEIVKPEDIVSNQ